MAALRCVAVVLALAVAGCPGGSCNTGGIGQTQAADPRPRGAAISGPATLTPATSCTDLLARLRANELDWMSARLLQGEWCLRNGCFWAEDPDELYSRSAWTDYPGLSGEAAAPALLRTDGSSIFLAREGELEGQLVVFGIPAPGELVELTRLDLDGQPSDLLLEGDRLVVVAGITDHYLTADDPRLPFLHTSPVGDLDLHALTRPVTEVSIFDVADPSAPRLVRQLYVEAVAAAVWLQGGAVRVALGSGLRTEGTLNMPRVDPSFGSLPEGPVRDAVAHEAMLATLELDRSIVAATSLDAFVPAAVARNQDGTVSGVPLTAESCGNVSLPGDGIARGLVSLLTFDTTDGTLLGAEQVAANSQALYASADTFVLATPATDLWWWWTDGVDETSFVHRFDVSTPGVTLYTGSARIPGVVDSDQAISVAGDAVRVVDVLGSREPSGSSTEPHSHVAVLAGASELSLTGQLGGLALGEFQHAVGFSGDFALLSTSPDPSDSIQPASVWVVDLSATTPHPAAHLVVPSAPEHFVPLGDGRLLATSHFAKMVGIQLDGVFPWLESIAVGGASGGTLDDTFDFADSRATEDWGWGYMTASAVTVLPAGAAGLVAVPLVTRRSGAAAPGCNAATADGYLPDGTRSSLQLVRVDPASGALSIFGDLDQSDLYAQEPIPAGYDCVWFGPASIDHSFVVHGAGGDYLYAVSSLFATVHVLEPGLLRTAWLPVWKRPVP